jgi:hypothetical protein
MVYGHNSSSFTNFYPLKNYICSQIKHLILEKKKKYDSKEEKKIISKKFKFMNYKFYCFFGSQINKSDNLKLLKILLIH